MTKYKYAEPIFNVCFLKSYNCPIAETKFLLDSEKLSIILRKIKALCCTLVFRCSEHETFITFSTVQIRTFAVLYTFRLCGTSLFNCLRT